MSVRHKIGAEAPIKKITSPYIVGQNEVILIDLRPSGMNKPLISQKKTVISSLL